MKQTRVLLVEGKLKNSGEGTTKQLKVAVNALNASGQLVTTDAALPMPQVIPPGGAASFVVRFPGNLDIRSFHVTAEIR